MDCPPFCNRQHSENYQALMSTLEVVHKAMTNALLKAKACLHRWNPFDTFFSLKLAFLVFSAAEQFSTNLQAKDTMIVEGSRSAGLLRAHYTSLRTEAAFVTFYQSVLHSASDLTDEPALPRYRKTPRRFDEGAQPHRYSSLEARYRHAYFEALDHACGEIQR